MRAILIAILSLAMCGCFDVRAKPNTGGGNLSGPVVQGKLDPAALSDNLAKQAELANSNPATRDVSSGTIQGILRHGKDAGLPAEWIDRVTQQVPAISASPPKALTDADIAAIRKVR